MKQVLTTTALGFCALLFGAQAHATLLDFSGFTGTTLTPVHIPGTGAGTGATITATDTNIFVGSGAAGQSDGFCFTNQSVSSCAFDGTMVFDNVINALMFDIDGWNTGDSVNISAYNGAALLGTLNFAANGIADFAGFGNLTSLVFDDLNSTGAGVGFSTFSFNEASVPEPSIIALLSLGLFGIGVARRKKS